MKRPYILYALLVICSVTIIYLGNAVYQLKKEAKETPLQVSMELKNSLMANNYQLLTSLYREGIEPISHEEFINIVKAYKGNTDYKNFEVIQLNEDTMVLVHFTHKEDYVNEVKVQSVKVIPKEMHGLFK